MNIIERILDVVARSITRIWNSGARPRAANRSPGSSFPTPPRARSSFSLPVQNMPDISPSFCRHRGAKPGSRKDIEVHP